MTGKMKKPSGNGAARKRQAGVTGNYERDIIPLAAERRHEEGSA